MENLRLRIVDLHKNLDVHQFTVRQIVYKWRKFSTVATLPRSGRPAKMTARAQRRMFNEVKKNPRVSA
jgi:transposase